MDNSSANEKTLAFSYLELRKIVGLLGIALPFILALGALLLFDKGIQNSISSYYHTGMGDVLVGTACVIGVFMFVYKGHEKSDDIVGDFACFFAVGLALIPNNPDKAPGDVALVSEYIHLACALGFFVTLIIFSLCLFTKTDPNKTPSKEKLQRNKVYRTCGYIMLICILLVAIYKIMPESTVSSLKEYKPVFWLESIAVIAFGISWLTKGEGLLADKP